MFGEYEDDPELLEYFMKIWAYQIIKITYPETCKELEPIVLSVELVK